MRTAVSWCWGRGHAKVTGEWQLLALAALLLLKGRMVKHMVVEAVIEVNEAQKARMVDKIRTALGGRF